MIKTLLTLLPLLAQVESNFDPEAVGDGGLAIGMYQIHQDYWSDGTDWMDVDWDYLYATDPTYSTYVVIAYLGRYSHRYEEITGKEPTMEVMARMHNGGPDGWKKESTLKYWHKIKALNDK